MRIWDTTSRCGLKRESAGHTKGLRTRMNGWIGCWGSGDGGHTRAYTGKTRPSRPSCHRTGTAHSSDVSITEYPSRWLYHLTAPSIACVMFVGWRAPSNSA